MYTNMTFGAAKAVLFIKVSSLQGVLIRGVPQYMYVCTPSILSVLREETKLIGVFSVAFQNPSMPSTLTATVPQELNCSQLVDPCLWVCMATMPEYGYSLYIHVPQYCAPQRHFLAVIPCTPHIVAH